MIHRERPSHFIIVGTVFHMRIRRSEVDGKVEDLITLFDFLKSRYEHALFITITDNNVVVFFVKAEIARREKMFRLVSPVDPYCRQWAVG